MQSRLILYILVISVLVQAGGNVLLLLQYQLNKGYITEQFCINKQRPELACEGSCHLQKQLDQLDDQPTEKQHRYKLSAETTWICQPVPRLQLAVTVPDKTGALLIAAASSYKSIDGIAPDHPPQRL